MFETVRRRHTQAAGLTPQHPSDRQQGRGFHIDGNYSLLAQTGKVFPDTVFHHVVQGKHIPIKTIVAGKAANTITMPVFINCIDGSADDVAISNRPIMGWGVSAGRPFIAQRRIGNNKIAQFHRRQRDSGADPQKYFCAELTQFMQNNSGNGCAHTKCGYRDSYTVISAGYCCQTTIYRQGLHVVKMFT